MAPGFFGLSRLQGCLSAVSHLSNCSHWQRQWLGGDVKRRLLDYWTAQLAGAPALLELPTDRPRPPVQRHHGATLAFAVDADAAAALYDLGKRAGTTLYVVLTRATQLLTTLT